MARPFCASGASGILPLPNYVPSAQPGPYYGCLGSQPHAAWFSLQIDNSGNLDILIQGTLTAGGSGSDVDFICWGPFSSLTGVCNSLTAANVVDY